MPVSSRAERLSDLLADVARSLRSDPRLAPWVNLLAPVGREAHVAERLLRAWDQYGGQLLDILSEEPPPPPAPPRVVAIVDSPHLVAGMTRLAEMLPKHYQGARVTAEQLVRASRKDPELLAVLQAITRDSKPSAGQVDLAIAERLNRIYGDWRFRRADEAPAATAGLTLRRPEWAVERVAEPAVA